MNMLDTTHQASLLANPHISDIIAAITAAGIGFEDNNLYGFQSTDVTAAQTIIDTEALWLPTAQTAKIQVIADVYVARIEAGRLVTVAGVQKSYQIDPASTANMTSVASMAQGGAAAWPAGFAWIAADNTQQPMTISDFLAFALNVGTYVSSLIL